MELANTLLETKNICKSYGSINALKDVNLNFSKNKIYGLFGRNGAGKTTLLDIISSRIFADRGFAAIVIRSIPRRMPATVFTRFKWPPAR